ncbi:MAG TPA: caspase family protein [Chryseolinea sp.]|nr:caspase family protein [Chryseolinea sp.]
MRLLSLFIITLNLLLAINVTAQDELRYALVIGNGDYPKEIGLLLNPVNDATAMAGELNRANFDVDLVTNATYMQLREAVRRFHDKLSSGPKDKVIGLFYYAGHGLQFQDENYLVPLDAKVQYEDDIVRMCFPVQRMVLSNMERTNSRMNIIILDACRNNPFPSATRSMGTGLGEIKRAYGSFVAYATAPGSVASDGTGKNGLYTQELLKAIEIPGLLIEQVFKEVRRNVLKLSEEKQYTWDASNIIGDFYFFPPATAPVVTQTSSTATQPETKPVETKVKPPVTPPSTRKVVTEEILSQELMSLTNATIPFKDRQLKQKQLLGYFVVPYATTYIMIGNRIDERLTATKLLDRLVTLPESSVKVVAMETSDSGKIVELSIELE